MALGQEPDQQLSLQQPTQELNNIVRYLGVLIQTITTVGESLVQALSGSTGSYTPTVTGETNISSVSPEVCHYIRIGNLVTVTGFFNATATAGSETATSISMSLPVASEFTTGDEASGVGAGSDGYTIIGFADTANNRIELGWAALSTNPTYNSFTFTYTVEDA